MFDFINNIISWFATPNTVELGHFEYSGSCKDARKEVYELLDEIAELETVVSATTPHIRERLTFLEKRVSVLSAYGWSESHKIALCA
ncbi:hypothetical protein [uncultured Pseudodesulfovibrio sp.]|uniref:hypothetical protein n=1 Tax=uncultured Pseudodesulfovibrio sp. TaxID=2035858 RepID=UPI0029C93F02|nr:hypothetical protein [uncultured Pseudodesulfovibrio sp.]